jgi:hypothetical protein
VVLVVGAAGEEPYGKSFAAWADLWKQAASRASAQLLAIGLEPEAEGAPGVDDRQRLQDVLSRESQIATNDFWLVLIGHGTFDGKSARSNLRGPDVSSQELAQWLKAVRRPVALINAFSSSGPFLNALSAPDRAIVTATKSGGEQIFSRFGGYLAQAIADPEADLDKDGQTSLLEAYLMASRRVADFYEVEGRLATEHALLDDNGDGLGTPADWFRGIRAVKSARQGAASDGLRAHQFHLVRSEFEAQLPATVRDRRDHLELEIERLRQSKAGVEEAAYYQRLETLLLDMATLYEPFK